MISAEKNNLEKENIVVLIGAWQTPDFLYCLLKKSIPSEYGYIFNSYTQDILNADAQSTKQNFVQFIEQIMKDLNDLQKTKPRDFFLYGQSLGGLFCMITADKIDVKKVMLVVPGANIAEAFWNGTKTRRLKQKMEKNGMTLDKLKDYWKEISPDYYFKNKSRQAKFYIVLSSKDKIIPSDNGRKLIEILKRERIEFELTETALSHEFAVIKESLLIGDFYKRLFKD
jgi:hypothetical protein